MRLDECSLGELARVHKALGDETRVRIVNLIAHRGEMCVCDVEAVLGISQSKASRHLAYLKNAGVVEDRRDRTWVYYRLASAGHPLLKAAVRELRRALADDETAQGDLARAETVKRAPRCAPIEAAGGAGLRARAGRS
jgi:ArsR family transcriptional regulator, arsenate/arsenite/antimonite-responsive transcriptional repressor